MPDHVFTVVCRDFSIDAQTNRLSLFSVLESMKAQGLPMAVPEIAIATLWHRQPGEEGMKFCQRTRFVDPTGKVGAHFDASFTLDKPGHRVLGRMVMASFAQSGSYQIEILVRKEDEPDWSEPTASYPIEVVTTQKPSQPLLPLQPNDGQDL